MQTNDTHRRFDWKMLILCICFLLAIGTAVFSLHMVYQQQQSLNQLQTNMNTLILAMNDESEGLQANESSRLLEYYVSLSDKADIAIDHIISVAATIFGISTISGLLLAFKAPRDIERSIDSTRENLSEIQAYVNATEGKLGKQVTDAAFSADSAKKSAEEAKKDASDAKYEVQLHEATDEFSSSDIIKELTHLIKIYPDKTELFLYRARQRSSVDQALQDLESARKLGLSDSQFYNEIAIIYANDGNKEEAIGNFTKSLSYAANSTGVLINRGKCYCELGEQIAAEGNSAAAEENFDSALEDFRAAENNGAKSVMLYLWRAFTYQNLYEICTDGSKTDFKLINENINEAYKLDYEKASVTLHARNRKKQIDDGMKSNQAFIATLLLKISSLESQAGDYDESFNSLIEAYSSVSQYIEDEEMEQKVLSSVKAYITEHDSPLYYHEHIVGGLALFRSIGAAAYVEYGTGNYLNAERLFRFVIDNCMKYEYKDYCINNLAYMIRRGETTFSAKYALDLIDQAHNQASLILCLNKALATYFFGSKDDYAYSDALECLVGAKYDQADLDEVISWWSDVEMVGELESKTALKLLSDSGVYKI